MRSASLISSHQYVKSEFEWKKADFDHHTNLSSHIDLHAHDGSAFDDHVTLFS